MQFSVASVEAKNDYIINVLYFLTGAYSIQKPH